MSLNAVFFSSLRTELIWFEVLSSLPKTLVRIFTSLALSEERVWMMGYRFGATVRSGGEPTAPPLSSA
jgi:hypothetical protein